MTETRRIFFSENTTRKRKETNSDFIGSLFLDYLFGHAIFTSTARAGSLFLSRFTSQTVFARSAFYQKDQRFSCFFVSIIVSEKLLQGERVYSMFSLPGRNAFSQDSA